MDEPRRRWARHRAAEALQVPHLPISADAREEVGGHLRLACEGRFNLLRRLLGRRVGLPGPEALARMEGMAIETLEDLAEALLDFHGPEDLATAWKKGDTRSRGSFHASRLLMAEVMTSPVSHSRS
ncbi:MAG: DUF4351 domain-containing protein [Candidatus Sericytochromatia bacterium]|nr:DUF4351 domain-containing protein [Candidatus Sericytochromatia bacterium]